MQALLILLSAIAILAAVFLGGCALLGVLQAFMPPRFADTHQVGGDGTIALISLVGGLVAAGLFVTGIALFRSVRGRRPPARKTAAAPTAGPEGARSAE